VCMYGRMHTCMSGNLSLLVDDVLNEPCAQLCMLFQWGTFDADTRASREKERRGRTDKRQAAKTKAKAQAIAQVRVWLRHPR
jgi:hypothetical protein